MTHAKCISVYSINSDSLEHACKRMWAPANNDELRGLSIAYSTTKVLGSQRSRYMHVQQQKYAQLQQRKNYTQVIQWGTSLKSV